MVEYIGIDIGGTNIKIGVLNENEELEFSYVEPTLKDVNDSQDLYNKIKSMIQSVPDYSKAKSIGIGFPGAIDISNGQILTAKNLEIFKGYPLVEKLTNEFNKPVLIENDARVAALAEAIKGKGKDKKIVCYITISTGLGGGVVIDKKIYHGSNNLGAYFSRMILDGENNSDELVSGTALLRQAQKRINKNISSTFELFELVNNKNEIAIQIIEEFKNNLTVLLLNISSSFNPDIIVIGGGVMKSKEYFLSDVINKFRENAHCLAKETMIEVAEFDEPGIIGAALMAKNK